MTDHTPNGENAPKLPSPKKKKTSAYDEPFGNEKTASFGQAPRQQTSYTNANTHQDAPQNSGDASSDNGSSAGAKKQSTRTASTAKKRESGNGTQQTHEDVHSSTATPRSSASSKKDTAQKVDMELPRSARPAHKVIPYVLLALALFVGAALLLNVFCNWKNSLTDPNDHWMGIVGYNICYFLFGMFGPAVFALPLILANMGIYWKRYIDNKLAISKIVASLFFLITLSAVVHIFCLIDVDPAYRNLPINSLMRHGAVMEAGGLIGGIFGYFLYSLCSFVGSLIIGFILLAASLFYFLGMTPQHLWNYIRNRRKTHAKRTPSYSEQSAEDAENRAKMDEKIRRVTNRQMNVTETEDFETEAPLGAVRVVKPAPAKKNPEDKIAPMPMPRLDPNDGDKLFVPETVNQRMAAMNQEDAPHTERDVEAPRASAPAQPQVTQPAVPSAPVAEPTPPINPASNRDAAVEPIFPKSAENRQVRRVPRAERDFDLKNIFVDLDESDARMTRKHAPVPPEVPLAPAPKPTPTAAATTAVKRPATAPTASNGAPVQRPATARPATATTPAAQGGQIPLPKVPTAGAEQKPLPKKAPAPQQKPAGAPTTPNAQPRPLTQPKDFGLTSEEFEKIEAQQISLPKAGAAAKKPVSADAAKSNKQEATTAEKKTPPKPTKPAKPKRYIFPPISYLHPGEPMTEENLAELEQSMNALEATLKSFHVNIEGRPGYACGPTVTRYEVTPAAGVRVRTITNLADDIALSLRAAGGIRIEAPIPGTNSVGIEVPNKTRSTIYLRELIESKVFAESKNKLTACLGAGIAGEPLIFDIAKMPHLLIAGTTGSGKSVCINCIVMSLLYKATPDEVKLVMIDPKKVEFSIYKNIPHLMAPVVTTPKDAAGALQAAVEEMERRFELFEQVGVRDLKGYNSATADDPDMPALPYIVIIIDELADLMMTARDEVETAICRIAQKARAAGMHLIIGTQRPSADVVTGLIKSNVPSRIAFAVKSQVDSRVILDHIGAEALTGRGDMLFVPIGSMRDTRVQGAFVDDKEVEKICEFIRATNGTAEYDEKFITKLKELAAQCGNKSKGGGDPMPSGEDGGEKGSDNKYADAVRIAIEEKRVSTSLLQRKLEIGYSRAAKLIDRMQSEGYVSPPDGSKPRTILITAEEYMEKFVNNPDGGEE